MTFTNLFGGLLFGCIGLAAFTIGRKRARFKMMITGIILMGFPYLMGDSAIALYALGGLLTASLFVFKE
ncbi:MAG: amino acid transport protein [Planctomycetes bacterium]|nr:amino acid transport protein [Planctomycetota bacterium]